MFFFDNSTFFYITLVFGLLFLGFYIWRKFLGLECYIKILEKKLSNLKKENKDLHAIVNGDDDQCKLDEADNIMNKIFNVQGPDIIGINVSQECLRNMKNIPDETTIICNSDKCIINNTKDVKNVNDIKDVKNVNDIKDVKINQLDDDVTIQDIIEGNVENIPVVLPVADHVEKDEKDVEIESVVSEVTNGVYNKKKLGKMNLDKLKEICLNMNVSTEGTKNTLIDRILSQ